MTRSWTGRVAHAVPATQNIPIRTEEGRRIRDAFVPKGPLFAEADYAGIESAILAHAQPPKEKL